ncbi:unnamed protein product [Darwinula stevensoni]|uniref:Protein msta n=1 Tax=Darwinula stevensoni TaxID=69355 RepID=A0A7R9AG21_9CRUS|nr:unnamed protein product [Darwinula stevensoni]CAG0903864.1 unnamed protein product [Darwinula stevensoni]
MGKSGRKKTYKNQEEHQQAAPEGEKADAREGGGEGEGGSGGGGGGGGGDGGGGGGSGETKCRICGIQARSMCAACKDVYYCSKEHQLQDWKNHKEKCLPFKTCYSETLGRHLVATRNIKEGEAIMKEPPLVAGPKQVSSPICLGCHLAMTGEYRCTECGWPVCGPKCQASPYHRPECELLSRSKGKVAFDDLVSPNAYYQCITPLRCLWLRERDVERWGVVERMESHVEERKGTKLFQLRQHNIVDFIRITMGVAEYDDDLIHEVCGVLDTNCFEIRHPKVVVRALYATACIMAHECRPNTRHCFDENLNIIVRATVPIKKGEGITTTYIQILINTYARRNHLSFAKCFWCDCIRCRDPTEFGTYLSGWRCLQCDEGKVSHVNPLDAESEWRCDACDACVEPAVIRARDMSLASEIKAMDKTVEKLEEFLVYHSDVLLPTSSYMVQVKFALVKIYGHVQGFMLDELSPAQLERKEELCRELLTVAAKLDRGLSRFRALLLYDLHEVIVRRSKTDEGRVREALRMLQECLEIISVDPGVTEEGQLTAIARKKLVGLQEYARQLEAKKKNGK